MSSVVNKGNTYGGIVNYGDIFASGADCLVNPVNCQGTMGAGLAAMFAERYPGIVTPYKAACENKSIGIGKVQLLYRADDLNASTFEPEYIINFPTKHAWSQPSRIEYIRDGLANMFEVAVKQLPHGTTIACPPLGCGLGGLSLELVLPLLRKQIEAFAQEGLEMEIWKL